MGAGKLPAYLANEVDFRTAFDGHGASPNSKRWHASAKTVQQSLGFRVLVDAIRSFHTGRCARYAMGLEIPIIQGIPLASIFVEGQPQTPKLQISMG